MAFKEIPYKRQKDVRSQMPDIPPEEWCDFRVELESGKTLKAIARKYHCDPRTVHHRLLRNQGSKDLGRQNAPRKIEPYVSRIEQLIHENLLCKSGEAIDLDEGRGVRISGICQISKRITEQIQKEGYSGSERTVRNYLRSLYYNVQKDS